MTSLFAYWLLVCMHRGVAKNNYLGGPSCNRDILNIILKSIGYKIINFHISSYTWILINIKNCLVQCRHTKKNIHIKSRLTTIFHGIKFIHYHLYSEIPCNLLIYINYHIICQKLILHSIAKSCFLQLHSWENSFCSCCRNWKGLNKTNKSINQKIDFRLS